MQVTQKQIEIFLIDVKRLADKETAQYKQCEYRYTVMMGKKYARIVRNLISTNNQIVSRAAFGFVDLENGDLLYHNGWAAPKKGARGNILNGTAKYTYSSVANLR